MSEVIERAARAAKRCRTGDARDPAPFDYGMARAVIESLREPTDEMMHAAMAAGARPETEGGRPGISLYPVLMWRAMLDAALKDQK